MNIFIKLAMTLILSSISVILYCKFRTEARLKCMVAMLLSTVGDLFMTNVVGIPEANAFTGQAIGSLAFVLAHIVYISCFKTLNKENNFELKNAGFYLGIAIMVISWIVLTILMFTMSSIKALMWPLITIYIAIIGYNLVENFSYSFNKKGIYYLNAIGIFVFYFSDIWIFLDMLCDYSLLHQYVWYIYPIGQILIILFNTPLKKEKEVTIYDTAA